MTADGLTPERVAQWIERVEVERKRAARPEDFPDLPDIPAGRYNDAAHFALERERFWSQMWLYAAHVDQVSEPGRFIVWENGSAPILIIRGDDHKIRAFYNTCQHRGAPVAREASGMAGNRLVCGYHGWSYDRQGKLLAVTESRDWQDITRRCIGLDEIRCEVFGGWIFVNESGSSESLEEFLQPITRFLTHLPLSELRLMHRSVVEVECNVKLLIDNFLEVYHFKLLHPRTTDKIFDSTGSNMHLWRNGHSMMLSPNRSRQWVDPGTRGMLEMVGSTDIEKYYNPSYCLFPNLIIPIAPTGMPFVSMWPKTVRSSTLEVLWFAPDPGTENRDPLWDTRIANFDRIVEEDIQFAEPMQKSIESPGFQSVPLSYQERRIYHWNVEVDRRIGEENIDPALRIAPTLGAFIE